MANLIEVKKTIVGEPVVAPEAKSITPQMVKGWEAYRDYLDQKGLYGSEKLNSQFGKDLFNKWASQNPQYGLNWNTLPLVGQELAKQKGDIAKGLQEKKITMNIPLSELNPTDVANLKTKNPWWPGKEFTSQGFTEHIDVATSPTGKTLMEKKFEITEAGKRRKQINK